MMHTALRLLGNSAALLLLGHWTVYGASTVIDTSFRDASAPGWVFGGTGAVTNGGVITTNAALLTAASGIDTPGNGWLRLTDTNSYLTGYALYTNAIPSSNSSIFVSLDIAVWGGSADGFVVFFYDASVPFSVGGSGGSLGYAQRYTSVNGMGDGYLGLGVDEFGNYSNPNEGRIGGPGQIANGIAVRGPGTGVSGYQYIAGTGDGITPRLPTTFYFSGAKSRPTNGTDARHLGVLLSPNNQLTVYFRFGTNAQFLCFAADLSKYTRPNNLKMGFAGSTGGSVSYHELHNLLINANVGIPWDNNSGDGLWATATNWHPDGVPVPGSEIIFDNTYVHTSQTVDLGGATRTVRGISFDAGFPYTLTNGTLSFGTNAQPAGRLAISQSGVNGTASATIAANLQISDDLTVDNASLGTLSLNGNLDNQGHTVYFAGLGIITVNGVISGAGQVVNYRSILTLTNNTYSGGTLLQNGATVLAADQAFGSSNVVFSGGTLQGTNGTRTITNAVVLQGSTMAIGGASPLTFTGQWSQTNSTLTINNTGLTLFSGGIVLADNNQSRTLTLNVATTARVDSVITNGPGSGPDGLTKAGLGTLTLSAANAYTGLTTVSGGTLALGGASERLHNSSTLMLAGGTINLAGYSETVGGTGYTNGAIDFGTGVAANYLMFTTNLPSSGSLIIFNFQAGVDHIAFRDTNTLSDAFTNGVYFSGYGVGARVTAAGQTIPGYSGTWRFIEPAEGQSIWDGGSTVDNKWSSPANWVGDVQPSSGPGVNVTFEGTPPRLAPDLDSARTVGQLRFNTDAAAFTLVSASGYTLTLDGTTPGISQQSANNEGIGHGLLLMTNTIFDTLGAGVLTVSGPISGAGGIAKYSSGELSLTASNSYGGTNILYNGLVNVQNGSALGSANTGTRVLGTATLEIAGNINLGTEPLTLNSPGFNNEGAVCNESGNNSCAGPITLEGSSRINTDGGSLTVSGTISNNLTGVWDLTVGGNGNVILSNVVATGSGTLAKDGSGTLTLKGASANTFSGLTTVSGGLLELGKTAGVIAIGGNLQIGDDSGSDAVRLLAANQISDAANVTLASSGLLDLNGFNETIANLNAPGTLAAVHLGAGTLTVSGFDNSSFNGVLSGSGALVKANAGSLTLTGPNTYGGTTTISGGVLRIEHNTALGNTTVAATVAVGAALELKNGIAMGAKPLSLTGSGIVGTGGGALRNIAGDNSWAGNLTLGGPARINSDAGTLTLFGTVIGTQALSIGGAGNTLISGLVGIGTAGLTLDAAGVVTLTGANTYSGATAVTAGTLVVANTSGSATGSGAVTLGSSTAGAILAGGVGALASGNKVSGLVTTMGTSPHIRPGNPGRTGTLNLGGGLTLGGTTPSMDYDLSSSDSTIGSGVNDLVNITGNLVVNSATSINVLFSGTPSSAKTYRLISYSGPKSGSGSLSLGSISPTPKNYTLDQSIAGQVNLSVNGLPAASAYRITPAGSPVAGVAYAITVTAVDASGNVLAGFNGDMDLTFSGLGPAPGHAATVAGIALGTLTTLTFTSATATANLVAYKAEGPVTLAATDGTFSTSSAGGMGATLTVGSSAATSALAVSGFPSPTPAGVPGNVAITALDSFGNTATGYRGTVHFTSSDSAAVLPADYTFVAGDSGTHIFIAAVTLKTTGARAITATDTATGTITGTQSGITVADIAPVAGSYARIKSLGAAAGDGRTPEGSLIVGIDGKLYGTTLAGGANGAGTIFRVETNGANLTVLYSFKNDGSDGRAPYCALLQGAGGVLYGTTYSGGSKDAGTVFRLNADGTVYAKLHDFGIGADGANAYAELCLGRDGKLYGTTLYGGANNGGTVFKIDIDGSGYTKLHDFGGAGDGQWTYAGLIQGPVGDDAFYGVTDSGGANGVGTVFKINGDGTGYTLVRNFSASGGDGQYPDVTLLLGDDGMLYSTTYGGGTHGDANSGGTVFKVGRDGAGYEKLHDFGGTGDEQLLNPGLVKGDQGALYGATHVGGVNGSLSSGGTLFKINTNGTGYRVLFNFPATPNDGQRLNASLVRDGSGAFYGTTEQGGDTGYGSLFRWADLGNVRLDNPATLAVTATATKFNPDQTLTFAPSSPPSEMVGLNIDLSSGAITWTPTKANVGQAYEVVWTVADSGNASLTAMNSFWVTVPNHAPGFSLNGSRVSVGLNPGAQTISDWAKDISAGPATETGQAVHFHVSNNNAGLFDGGGVAPAISDGGTLTFTPKTGATGHATVTVYAQDDGGTALGGQDTSPSQTFDIFVSQASLAIQTQPSASAIAGVAFSQQPLIWVLDGAGTLMTGDNATVVTVARNSGSGTRDLKGPNSPITVTVSGGIATFIGLKYEGAESIRLDFSAGGLATVTSDLITVSAADPRQLVFTRQPTKEIAGIPFSVQPIIRLQDAYANFTTPTASSLNVTMALSQGSGTLSGTKVLDIGSSAGNGTVTYTDLSIDTGGANKRLTASAGTLTDAVSAIFEVTQNQPPVFTGAVATVVQAIKSFGAATPSGMNPSGSLILGTDAMLYGTTEFGGDNAEGTVFAVNPDGTGFRLVHAFAEQGEVPESGGEYPRAAVLEVSGALYGTTYAGGKNSFGTVFKVNKDGTGFVILHQFGGKPAGDGAHPAAALVVGSSGALYGTTEDGGTDGLGTVFSLASDGSGYSILHSFSAAHGDGTSPHAALLKASDGALFGTTERGGAGGNGTVFRLNGDGTGYDVVYAFAGGSLGNYPAAALIEVDGALYGTTSAGGANQVGTVFQLNPNGTGFRVLHSFSSPDGIGQNVVSGLMLGLNGALYGATTAGGANDAGMIYQITTASTPVFSILHDFGISDENSARPSLVQRVDGRIFGTTFFGGPDDLGTVFAMDAQGSNFQVLKEFLTTANGAGWYPDAALTEGAGGVFYGTTYDGGTARVGTVYRINGDGTGCTVLHSLGATVQDGTNSAAPLTLSGGVLYGTTLFGGSYGGGTVFKIGTDGTGYAKLRDFGGTGDGATLWGCVILGSDGLLYGLTLEGGTHGKGTVFKIDTNGGSYDVIHHFGAIADDGVSPYARLAQGPGGTLYGLTYAGGTANAGTIFSLSPDGAAYSVLHRFGVAAGDGVHPWAGVLVNNGMLYGTTYDGGADDLGMIFRINVDGSGYANLHSFGTDEAQHPYSALVLGSDAAIYGTTWLGGSSDRGGIFRIRSDGTYDPLYSFDQGKNPYCGLALGSDGLFYGTTESGGSYNLGTAFRMQVLGAGGISLDETSTLTLRVLATDPDSDENLDYSLVTAPDGMTIDAQAGVITWTPAEGTGPGTYPVTVKVTDNRVPPLSDTTNFTVTVNEKVMGTTTTVASSLNPSLNGQPVSFTATVTKDGGDDPLTGTVTFKTNGVPLGGPVALVAGQAALSTSGLAVGTHVVAAEYSGLSGVYYSSTGTVSQAVSKASTTASVESNLNPSRGGQPVTFKATVTAVAPGAGIPGGTATFKDGAITLGPVSLDGAGSASLSTTAVGVGTRAITVEYGGDSSFESSIGTVWQTVEDAGTWSWGDSYTWRISNATGTAGTGWDWLDIAGSLDISATVENPFTIKIVSLSGSSAGPAANFDNTQNYTWPIATASGGVTGFAADKFIIDDTAFVNDKGDGHFSVTQSGNSVYLHFGHVTASPFSIGRAWGTFLRIPVAAVKAKVTGGTAPYTILSVTSRESADFVRISGDYILFAPVGNTNSILDYSVEDFATPTRSTAGSIINVTITNAISSVNSISNNVASGTVIIRFAGIPGYGYAVERSGDLANWDTVWATNAPAGGVWMFTDGPDPAPPNPSYYRLRQND